MILKTVRLGLGAFATILFASLTLAPPTAKERAALGDEPPRFDLIQMRLAGAMMRVAPQFAVSHYARATGLPEGVIRDHLTAKAEGRLPDFAMTAPRDGNPGWGAIRVPLSENVETPREGSRRTAAGGALFVKPD